MPKIRPALATEPRTKPQRSEEPRRDGAAGAPDAKPAGKEPKPVQGGATTADKVRSGAPKRTDAPATRTDPATPASKTDGTAGAATIGTEPRDRPGAGAKRQAEESERLIKPVDGPITSHAGEESTVRSGRHTGTDFGAPVGTPVKAAASGKVVSAGDGGAFGNEVIIQHGERLFTEYAHLESFTEGLSVGDTVKQGQVIGKVGMTGNTTGAHLHFEVRSQQGFDRENRMDSEQLFGRAIEEFAGGRIPLGKPSAHDHAVAAAAPVSSGSSNAVSTGGGAPAGGSGPTPAPRSHGGSGGGGQHAAGGGSRSGAGSSAAAAGAPDDVAAADTAVAPAGAGGAEAAVAPLTPLSAEELAVLAPETQALLQQFAQLTPEQQVAELLARIEALEQFAALAAPTAEQQQAHAQLLADMDPLARTAPPEVLAQLAASGIVLPTSAPVAAAAAAVSAESTAGTEHDHAHAA